VDLPELHLVQGPNRVLMESTTQFGMGADRSVFKADGGSSTQTDIERFELQASMHTTLPAKLAAEQYFFLPEDGDVRGAAQLVATWPLQDNLNLEPRVAVGWQIEDLPKEGLSRGFGNGKASVRLRRTISAKSDVYIGFVHQQLLGKTRQVTRVTQQTTTANILVAGLDFRF
jgi:copper resistance protein B